MQKGNPWTGLRGMGRMPAQSALLASLNIQLP
jgi:hypothetical protein